MEYNQESKNKPPKPLKNLRTPDIQHLYLFFYMNFMKSEFYRLTKKYNDTRRELIINITGPCLATNPIDQCCRFFWFGYQTGKGCKINIMIDPSDNNTVNPKHGKHQRWSDSRSSRYSTQER